MEVEDKIKEIADEVDGSIRYDYSGRGMFGDICYGIVCDDANKCLEVAGSKGITGGRTDSMGLQMIVYWPNLKPKEK